MMMGVSVWVGGHWDSRAQYNSRSWVICRPNATDGRSPLLTVGRNGRTERAGDSNKKTKLE